MNAMPSVNGLPGRLTVSPRPVFAAWPVMLPGANNAVIGLTRLEASNQMVVI